MNKKYNKINYLYKCMRTLLIAGPEWMGVSGKLGGFNEYT
jgi:hypothetical protein